MPLLEASPATGLIIRVRFAVTQCRLLSDGFRERGLQESIFCVPVRSMILSRAVPFDLVAHILLPAPSLVFQAKRASPPSVVRRAGNLVLIGQRCCFAVAILQCSCLVEAVSDLNRHFQCTRALWIDKCVQRRGIRFADVHPCTSIC